MLALRSAFMVFACLISLAFASPPAHAATCAAADTVQGAADAFLQAANSGTPAAFSAALSRYANVEAVAIFALGKYRSDLPDDRRAEYIKKAQSYMGKFLSNYGDRFRGSMLSIKSCKGQIVETSVKGGEDLIWRVSGSQVQDVKVSGFWLTIQLRKKFTDVIRQRNRRVEGLIDFLGGH